MKLEFIDNQTKSAVNIKEITFGSIKDMKIGMAIIFDFNHPNFPWLDRVSKPILAKIVNIRPRVNSFAEPYAWVLTLEFPNKIIAGHDGGFHDQSENRWHWSIHKEKPKEIATRRRTANE